MSLGPSGSTVCVEGWVRQCVCVWGGWAVCVCVWGGSVRIRLIVGMRNKVFLGKSTQWNMYNIDTIHQYYIQCVH